MPFRHSKNNSQFHKSTQTRIKFGKMFIMSEICWKIYDRHSNMGIEQHETHQSPLVLEPYFSQHWISNLYFGYAKILQNKKKEIP